MVVQERDQILAKHERLLSYLPLAWSILRGLVQRWRLRSCFGILLRYVVHHTPDRLNRGVDEMNTVATARVQIIDPDQECCEWLAVHLRGCGYQVETCGSLSEGLQQSWAIGFDLLLVEQNLPETSGLDALPQFQALPHHPCVLLMSSDPSTVLVRDALRAGAFDFLIKPLEPALLEKSVAAGLENRKAFLKIYHLSRELQETNRQLQAANQQLSQQTRLLEAERDHLKELVRELNALNAFSRAICSTLDTGEIVALVASELATLLRYDLCTLTLFSEAQVRMYFHATLPIPHRLVEEAVEHFVTASPSLLGRQVSLSEVIYEVTGCMEFGEQFYDTHLSTTSSAQAVAHLVVAGESLGLLSLYRFSNDAFTVGQTRLLSTLANQVALAFRNAREYRKTQELALRDGLTRLYNHAAFQHFLEREFESLQRHHRPVSLIMFDIDHFKAINDTYGHQMGDFVLQELARLSLTSIRKTDLLARYGGEEFALILPDTDLPRAQSLAHRLWQKVQNHRFAHGDTIIRITISLGVASTGTPNVRDKEDLIRVADAAMYRAKEAGRNHYYIAYGDQMFRCPQDVPPVHHDSALSHP